MVQLEVCRTFSGRGYGYEYHSSEMARVGRHPIPLCHLTMLLLCSAYSVASFRLCSNTHLLVAMILSTVCGLAIHASGPKSWGTILSPQSFGADAEWEAVALRRSIGRRETMLAETMLANLRARAARVCWCKCTGCTTKKTTVS